MGNPLPLTVFIGTIGELLVQLRLLEYGIQAAPPIKDSGNDLIAIKDEVVKYVQIKTRTRLSRIGKKPKTFHLIALVILKYDGDSRILLDDSEIWIIKKGESEKHKRILSKELVKEIWG